jgi:hypothetical protein
VTLRNKIDYHITNRILPKFWSEFCGKAADTMARAWANRVAEGIAEWLRSEGIEFNTLAVAALLVKCQCHQAPAVRVAWKLDDEEPHIYEG